MKEAKFNNYEQFIEHVHSYKSVKNQKNFKYFSFEKVGSKIHANRWFLIQHNETNQLMIKYYSTVPKHKVISYANVRHEV